MRLHSFSDNFRRFFFSLVLVFVLLAHVRSSIFGVHVSVGARAPFARFVLGRSYVRIHFVTLNKMHVNIT